MSDTQSNNKRIAKNTMLLYIRMLVMMFISLFTSRVVLQALGVEDYGIYNIVGGVVAMFSILSTTLNAAIVRFISVELGNNDKKRLNQVFCTSVTTQLILIGIIVFLLESVGLWFLNYKLVIPEDRIIASNWVFQLSVLTFAINMWSIPYNATIGAHERMDAFAYVSIFESIAKLLVAYMLLMSSYDKLILYSVLLCFVSIIVRVIYGIYCKRNFEECLFHFYADKKLLKEMFGFAGWNFLGASSTIIREQGSNIILNLFFGPAVNAAKGLALTVNSAVTGFSGNFMAAVNPQIYKNYSRGDKEYTLKLVYQSTRLSFYIFILLGLPIIATAPYLLQLWLGNVPEHTINFVRLVIIFSMSESLAGPLLTLAYATGNIKIFQIIIGTLQILNIPITYLFLHLSYPPEIAYVISIVISIICEIARVLILRKIAGLDVKTFLMKVYFNVILVTAIASLGCWEVSNLISHDNFIHVIWIVLLDLIIIVSTIYIFGLSTSDRILVKKQLTILLNKIHISNTQAKR